MALGSTVLKNMDSRGEIFGVPVEVTVQAQTASLPTGTKAKGLQEQNPFELGLRSTVKRVSRK